MSRINFRQWVLIAILVLLFFPAQLQAEPTLDWVGIILEVPDPSRETPRPLDRVTNAAFYEDRLYFTETEENKFFVLDLATDEITELFGTSGFGAYYSNDVVIDKLRDYAYIFNLDAETIFRYSLSSGKREMLGEDMYSGTLEPEGGNLEDMQIFPSDGYFALDADDNILYLVSGNLVVEIDLNNETYQIIGGTNNVSGFSRYGADGYQDGGPQESRFANPAGVVFDENNNYLYIADFGNRRIRKLDLSNYQTSLVAGSTSGFTDGYGEDAQFNAPIGLALDEENQILYVSERDRKLRRINLSNNKVETIFDATAWLVPSEFAEISLDLDNDLLYVTTDSRYLLKVDLSSEQNFPPQFASVTNKSIDEGDSLQFTIFATDEDGDQLTYSASNLPNGAEFDSSTQTFTWTPSYEQSGTYEVTFTVSDGEFTDSETIEITVNDVNLSYEFKNPKIIGEYEDGDYYGEVERFGDYIFISNSFGYYGLKIFDVSDPTNPQLAGVLKPGISLGPTIEIDEERGLLFASYQETENGVASSTVEVWDVSDISSLEVITTLNDKGLDVENGAAFGRMEVQDNILIVAINRGFRLYDISDVNNITLLGEYLTDKNKGCFEYFDVLEEHYLVTDRVSGFCWPSQYGNYVIDIQDSTNPVFVKNVSDVTDRAVFKDKYGFTTEQEVSDPDYSTWYADLVVYDFSDLDNVQEIKRFRIKSGEPDTGIASISDLGIWRDRYLWTVRGKYFSFFDLQNPANPILLEKNYRIPDFYPLVLQDSEEDNEYLYMANGRSGLKVLQYLEKVEGHTPFFSDVSSQFVNEGEILNFTISATDEDGDELTYSASNLPNGAEFDSSTQTFTWTPSYEQSGTYEVTFAVSDGALSDSEEITITVNEKIENQAPSASIDSISPNPADEGETITFEGSGTDPDEDPIVAYKWRSSLDGIFGEEATVEVNLLSVGDHTISFKVKDEAGNWSEEVTANLTVNTTKVNQPPELDSVGDQSMTVGELLEFAIFASDPDGDKLVYSASGLPRGASFDADNQKFLWLPSKEQEGSYSVTFSVSDGELEDSEVISIAVVAKPTPKLYRRQGDHRVYEIRSGKKHWLPNPQVFDLYGFKWNDIQEKDKNEVDQYPRVKLLRKAGEKKVYYLTESGMVRHIPSSQVFVSYGNKWEDVIEIVPEELEVYIQNELIHLEGDYRVYLLKKEKKRWIKTAKAFNRLGYDWSKIAPVNQTEFDFYAEGNVIE